MTDTPEQFSAADSTLGYLYQVRVALLWSLRRLKKDADFLVSLETLDDVVFEANGSPEELLQTKCHQSRTAALTDASPDLWKTLRVWFAAFPGADAPAGAALHLLTTGTASAGSAASLLRLNERDVEKAQGLLDLTAQTSSNKDNKPAYAVYLSAAPAKRKAILEAVVVMDGAPLEGDLDALIRDEIFWVVLRRHHDVFLQRLEGWWLRRVLKQLRDPTKADRILGAELEAEMADLREQFKRDALPIDDDLLAFVLDEATESAHAEFTFVKQLALASPARQRVVAAIRDYYRAYEQRSRWLRDDLVLVGDLQAYENRLVEEWELAFAQLADELGGGAVEEEKLKVARRVLAWAENAQHPIRPGVTERFVTRGSLHMLADEVRVGWHPEFRDRLAGLLSSGSGGGT